MSRTVYSLLAMGLVCLCTSAAQARPRNVAVLPVSLKGEINAALAARVQTILDAGPSTSAELVTLSGKLLARALDGAPQRAVTKCEHAKRFDLCFRKVATQLNVDEVLVSRLSRTPNGARLQILGFSASGKVEQRLDVTKLTPASVERELNGEQVAKIFGVPYRDPKAPPEPETSPTQVIAAPLLASPSNVLPAAPKPYIAAAPSPPAKSASGLWWGGWLLTAAGAGTAGVGAYFGLQSVKAGEALPQTSVTQRKAMGRYDSADEQASLANTLFAVGGGVALTGVVCLIVDLASD